MSSNIIYVYVGNPKNYVTDNDYDFITKYTDGKDIEYIKPEKLNRNQVVYCFDQEFKSEPIRNIFNLFFVILVNSIVI